MASDSRELDPRVCSASYLGACFTEDGQTGSNRPWTKEPRLPKTGRLRIR